MYEAILIFLNYVFLKLNTVMHIFVIIVYYFIHLKCTVIKKVME
jgi:hypothetical protein